MDKLSNELLIHICMFLHPSEDCEISYLPKDLLLFGRCNWYLYTLTKDNYIWKYIFKYTYPHIYVKYKHTSTHWKLLFDGLMKPYTIPIITPYNRYTTVGRKLLTYNDYYITLNSNVHLQTFNLIILTDKTNTILCVYYQSKILFLESITKPVYYIYATHLHSISLFSLLNTLKEHTSDSSPGIRSTGKSSSEFNDIRTYLKHVIHNLTTKVNTNTK